MLPGATRTREAVARQEVRGAADAGTVGRVQRGGRAVGFPSGRRAEAPARKRPASRGGGEVSQTKFGSRRPVGHRRARVAQLVAAKASNREAERPVAALAIEGR